MTVAPVFVVKAEQSPYYSDVVSIFFLFYFPGVLEGHPGTDAKDHPPGPDKAHGGH